MSRVMIDFGKVDCAISAFEGFRTDLKNSMDDMKSSVEYLDKNWSNDENKLYMGAFNEVYSKGSTYDDIFSALLNFCDYLRTVNDRYKKTKYTAERNAKELLENY